MSYHGRNGLFRKKGVSINCAPAHGTVKGQSYTRSTLVSQNLNSISKNLSIPDWFLLAYWRNPKADALASPFLSKNDGRALDGIWSWATVRHPWPTRGGLIASSGLTRVAVRRCSSMLTVFETLWYACLGIYRLHIISKMGSILTYTPFYIGAAS